ncbi:hypothetical protein [Cnuella takakiae]|nr:hypothetical protein [Cnuella takakiae]OLY92131.1 hypothetical protein BUE76_09650 [Cnuella takakiae]
MESDETEGSLQIIYNNIGLNQDRVLQLFHVVHLRFAKLNRRELNNQLRFLGSHPMLFTHMVLVICEVDASLGIKYVDIAQVLEQRSAHRLNMDYFLVLCNKSEEDTYRVSSVMPFICQSAIDYFSQLGEPGNYLIEAREHL